MSILSKRVVLMEDPDNQPDDSAIEFRLTYEGLHLATQRDPVGAQVDKRAENKHAIRKTFHSQLKRLWEITPFLKRGYAGAFFVVEGDTSHDRDATTLSKKHASFGFNFVPLVTQDLDLICGLDILFLRPDISGNVLRVCF